MDILDLCCSLEDGDIVEIYVKRMIDQAVVDPNFILLENVSHEDRVDSGSTFNKGAEPNCGPNIVVGDETLSDPNLATADPISVDPTTVDPNNIDVGPVGSDLVEGDGSDYSTEESVDTEGELVGDDDEDYSSDVHEEFLMLNVDVLVPNDFCFSFGLSMTFYDNIFSMPFDFGL
ncbi:hypothetical protein RDI58_007292 [Solanum bulbocastanum]|uniref:Uncharacterized protein n=1 Tax=Solanum bulbocastanum TaxID=147425 RepID=A0AAN8YHK3_SOLBU